MKLRALLLALALLASCRDKGDTLPCQGDLDCPQGAICREGICGFLGGDAGAVTPLPTGDAGTSPTCAADGVSCTLPSDCCANACTLGRCGAPITPTCRGIYEFCQDDCCAGLTCRSGTCR